MYGLPAVLALEIGLGQGGHVGAVALDEGPLPLGAVLPGAQPTLDDAKPDGDFLIDVECRGDSSEPYVDAAVGSSVMVSGMLVRKKLQAREMVKLKVHKIFWMEE